MLLRSTLFVILILLLAACQPGSSVVTIPTPTLVTQTTVLLENRKVEKILAESDSRWLDNCNGSGQISQTVNRGRIVNVEIELEVGATIGVGLKAIATTEIETKLSVKRGEELQASESVTLDIGPGYRDLYEVKWFETWEIGEIFMEGERGAYRVRLGYSGIVTVLESQYCGASAGTLVDIPTSLTMPPTSQPPLETPTPPSASKGGANPYQNVIRNSDWTPIYKVFAGVEMALVPTGCFAMGSNTADDETPVHQQCINTPFWMDRYEVTNGVYGSSGAFSGSNMPRESVSWTEAYAHCQSRGARLPNEVEWEYAARGPESYTYPWGNMLIDSNLSYYPEYDFSTRQYPVGGSPKPVGSYPNGASWVGVLDLSGNVWEWVNSRYATLPVNGSIYKYPYNAQDGREQYSPASDTPWGLRGGSWGVDAKRITAHFRNFSYAVPQRNAFGIGFRCVRPYAEGD
jgi:formylglycine-generating enzyme required for sulfatase activity